MEEGEKLGLNVTIFTPVSFERNDLITQLSNLCQDQNLDFVLLDFDLWRGFEGDSFVETLKENKIKFVAFSGSGSNNSFLVELGAIFSIQKDYNSNGFNRKILIYGLTRLLN